MRLRVQNEIEARIYEACAQRVMAEPRRRYLGMSEIGDPCARKLWMNYHLGCEHREIDGKLARIFDMGHAVEARVIADLRAAGFEVLEAQQELFDPDLPNFRGHIDGLINGVTQKTHILEIKSANDSKFKSFQRGGIKSNSRYSAQVQCYMGFSNLERALFVVENKNNQELYVERVYFEQDAFQEIRAKARLILEAPSPLAKNDVDCYFCDYRGLDCEAVDTPDCSRCRYHFNFSCLSEDYLKSFRPSPLGRALFDLYNFKNIDIKFNNGDICLSKGVNVPSVGSDFCDYSISGY